MSTKQQTNIEKLIDKAAEAEDSHQAMQYSQAACNAAKALRELQDIVAKEPERG